MRGPNRRAILRSAGGASVLASGLLAAPPILAQTKSAFAGTTINASCFQTTYFEYLKAYFPEFEQKTGIKVNFTMQAFPVYNQRTDLELSTAGRRSTSATSPSSIPDAGSVRGGSPASTASPRIRS